MEQKLSGEISFSSIRIIRADRARLPEAFAIVTQYYEAFQVWEREDRDEFAAHYFGARNGFWLAMDGADAVGCVGLRELAAMPGGGEVKRLFVLPQYRRQQIAERLLGQLEAAAVASGCEWLYLDSNENFADALQFYRKHGYVDCERYNTNAQATLFLRKRVASA